MQSTIENNLDCRGVKCPMPIVMISKAMRTLGPGQTLSVEADDPAFRADLEAWVKKLGYSLLEFEDGATQKAIIKKTDPAEGDPVETLTEVCNSSGVSPAMARFIDNVVSKAVADRFEKLEERIEQSLATAAPSGDRNVSNRATIVVFSGDMDKLMAAFIIANGAAAMEMEVSMFFTFWGLASLKDHTLYKGKTLSEKLVSGMLPSNSSKAGTSKMNMLGMGPAFFKSLMKRNNVESLPRLIDRARDLGVNLVACRMSMDIMGIREEEMIGGVEYGGVATYIGNASDSAITLFI